MATEVLTRALLRSRRAALSKAIARNDDQALERLRTKAPAVPRKRRTGIQFDWADTLAFQVTAAGLPAPARDRLLCKPRLFRTDLSWADRKLFVECDGAEWTQGQHGRGRGMQDDCIKWNTLTLQGWRGLRFTGSQVKSGYALTIVEHALAQYIG